MFHESREGERKMKFMCNTFTLFRALWLTVTESQHAFLPPNFYSAWSISFFNLSDRRFLDFFFVSFKLCLFGIVLSARLCWFLFVCLFFFYSDSLSCNGAPDTIESVSVFSLNIFLIIRLPNLCGRRISIDAIGRSAIVAFSYAALLLFVLKLTCSTRLPRV